MRVLKKENAGYSTSVITNVHISTSNGNPLLTDQVSPEEDGIMTFGNNDISNMLVGRFGKDLEKNKDKTKYDMVFIPGTDPVAFGQKVQSKYNEVRSFAQEIRKESNLWRNAEIDKFLQDKGVTLEQVRENNQIIDSNLNQLRKLMQAKGKVEGQEEKLEEMKGRRNPHAKYNIVITTQIEEVFNKDPLVGGQIEIPIDAVVDKVNPNIYRKYTNKQPTVICYRFDFYNQIMDELKRVYDGIEIMPGSDINESDLLVDINEVNELDWDGLDIKKAKSLDDSLFTDVETEDFEPIE